MGTKGIQEVKDVIVLIAAILNEIDKRKAKPLGKFRVVLIVMGLIPAIARALNGITQIPKEFMDLDDAERAELVKMVNETIEFGTSDQAEEIIDKSINVVIQLSAIVQVIVAKHKPNVSAGSK